VAGSPTGPERASDGLAGVGVVVVAYASAATLPACLRALPVGRLHGVVVVDNASPDDTAAAVAGCGGVRVVRLARNVGFGAGAMAGAAALPDARLLCLLNPDARIDAANLEALVRYLDRRDGTGLVAPRLFAPDGTPLTSSGERATLASELRYALPRRLARFTPDRRHPPGRAASGPVGYVEGACLLVRADAFRAVGGFDPGFFLFFEELDLAERLRAAGHGVELCAGARAVHSEGASRAALPGAGRVHYVASTVRYLRRHRGRPAALAYRRIAGGWWYLAGLTGRLDRAETRAWRAALHLAPPAPARPGHPRVLLVAVEAPWPARTGAQRRLGALSRQLAGRADLAVLAAVRDPAALDPPGGFPVWAVRRSPSRWRSALAIAAALPGRRPLFAGFYRRRNVRTALRRALALHQPRVVLTHEIGGTAVCRGVVGPAMTVLDLHNAEHDLFADLPGLRWRVDAGRLRGWARRELPGYAAAAVVSAADADSYRRLAPAARLVLAPNGADLPERARPDPGGARLLLLGDLGYPPNAEGLAWLLRNVVPLLRQPVTIRHVGGGKPPPGSGVEAAGVVDDLTPEWAQAAMLLVPLRTGGGTRLKVLEAFAAGVPVVSTSVGVAGLDGAAARVADEPAAFAAAVDALLDEPGTRAALADAGRRLVEDRYTWDRTLRPLVDTVTDLAR